MANVPDLFEGPTVQLSRFYPEKPRDLWRIVKLTFPCRPVREERVSRESRGRTASELAHFAMDDNHVPVVRLVPPFRACDHDPEHAQRGWVMVGPGVPLDGRVAFFSLDVFVHDRVCVVAVLVQRAEVEDAIVRRERFEKLEHVGTVSSRKSRRSAGSGVRR